MRLEDVAIEVGITKAAIYRYYGSKRQLARAAVLQSTPFVDEYYEELAVDCVTLPDHLRALIKACMRVSLENPEPTLGYFQMGRLANHDEELAVVFRDRSAAIRLTIAGLIDDAIVRGEITAQADRAGIVDSVSGLLWAMTSGAAEAKSRRANRQLELAAELLLRRPPWETAEAFPNQR